MCTGQDHNSPGIDSRGHRSLLVLGLGFTCRPDVYYCLVSKCDRIAGYSYHLLRRPLTQSLLSVTVLEEILNSYVLVAY